MKIVIASGKGGVGKSMVASSLAILFSQFYKVIAVDCDVDAPNLHLWLGVTQFDSTQKISTSEKAFIREQKSLDDSILKVCKFGAIERVGGKYRINPFLCEGCGVCKLFYPNAIELKEVKNGEIRIAKTAWNFPLISAQLYPGESGSGKIVEEIKKKAEEFNWEIQIRDAAAGIGCPVIASLKDCDLTILIAEPTLTSFHDLKRILEVVNHFKIEWKLVINKWNIHPKVSKQIERWAGNNFLGKISYDEKVVEALVKLKPVITQTTLVKEEITKIFEKLRNYLPSL